MVNQGRSRPLTLLAEVECPPPPPPQSQITFRRADEISEFHPLYQKLLLKGGGGGGGGL